ncbi:GTP pyrophosphokinase [Motilibacter deserti]|uniref:GTP pyrophosphokinase n=1 Tax=Motilibacter deserti TaxID=2714956 RepID=UPI002F2B5856
MFVPTATLAVSGPEDGERAVGVVDDFVARYAKEYDFYEEVSRRAARLLESDLQASGVRAIVTSRAKSIPRLEEKCRSRERRRPYGCTEDIYDDIVDLAGVRVALYFPAERERVGSAVRRLFEEYDDRREFPAESQLHPSKRFSGYSAHHYRVRLRDADLDDRSRRYAVAKIEIQVASVLMHAWAEVEHDLVYKPLEGNLSAAEYSLLDQLNGLVLAGEIALEQLQRAGEVRVTEAGRSFDNHYDLASYLFSRATSVVDGPIAESGLGHIDLLYTLLDRLNLTTPDALAPYLTAIHANLEERPLAEQVIDALLSEDESRYDLYQSVREEAELYDAGAVRGHGRRRNEQLGYFLSQWVRLEALIRTHASTSGRGVGMPTRRALAGLGITDSDLLGELDYWRTLRNRVVHGEEDVSAEQLRDAGDRLERLIKDLEVRLRPNP